MSKRVFTVLALTALTVFVGMSAGASATVITLANPGFEVNPASDPNGFGSGVSGWSLLESNTPPASSFVDTFDPGSGGGGYAGENNYLLVQAGAGTITGGNPSGAAYSSAGQTNVTTIMPNSAYILKFDVGSYTGFPFPPADNDDALTFGGPEVLVRLWRTASGLGFGELAGVTLVNSYPTLSADGKASWNRLYRTNASPAFLGEGLSLQLVVQSNAADGDVRQLHARSYSGAKQRLAVKLGWNGAGVGRPTRTTLRKR